MWPHQAVPSLPPSSCLCCSIEGAVAALVSVAVVVTAAAFMLLCAATAAAGAFGTVVVREFAYGLTDGGCTQMSVTVASSAFAGVFTSLCF